ncbi:response regulator [Flavobacterium sp. CYK-4]|uniref:response regulator n=1 Tax=Flavobacterium lotistagni TaxID=2709660 RepID=UPI00140BF139|nr:response regulator [Flavobacterium lotistagni]NHM07135.1 response regulator [Flavobacterium lotistagni]
MDKSMFHKNLKRQIDKFLPEDLVAQNPDLLAFLKTVNQTYLNYEKDAELFEQSAKLNDKEYAEMNAKLKGELEKRVYFQQKLVEAIKQLDVEGHELDDENLLDLIHILQKEIEIKADIQRKLFDSIADAKKANDAKSDFLSIMSHEIRTPLNAIIGLIYIMEKENSLQSFHENIEVLKNSAQNLFLLINDILDFSKIEAGKVDIEKIPFDLVQLAEQIAKSMEARASENLNKIQVVVDADFVPNLISDPLRINQIITNLVSNAVKFTYDGNIQIRLKQIAVQNKFSTFKVEVVDNGIGIEKDKFQSIFEKFTQAETKTSRLYGGTGLGLVITKKLLALLGSEIKFESEIGVGSNFYFTMHLPIDLKQNAVNTHDLQEDYKEQNLRGLKVLLVEDNLINIKIAQKIMGQWEVEVDLAENGLIGVEKYRANKYDVILMDLSMPVMDGYEATTTIRQDDKLIPIIALTASASFGYLDRALQIGINEYIIKPFNPKELNMKLRKYYHP